MTKIPSFIKPLFWDIDFSNLQSSNHSHFIIKRVLDRGNTSEVNWLLDKFPRKDIVETITTSRDLSQKTANFWSDIYGLDRSNIRCLQKPYFPTQFGLSS